ncbi:diacylglycerol O-acyltransferase 1-like [Chiloscyllium plagiosum]|uniref:diacylglycerol O-acyltransferase 1-like n=1 Tax=Chiloscyllium plagiosum TaxID=36176 RepID=UPI001CB7CEFE|nr:diacylglycerol O-acyltransferase 1-like [Chiloscyllium plagiosum]
MASHAEVRDTSPKLRRKSTPRFSNIHVRSRTMERSKFYEDLVEEMRRKMCCHKNRESLLSSSSGFFNYRGMLNWAVVVLLSMSERSGYAAQMINLGAVLFFPLCVLTTLSATGAAGSALVLGIHSIMFMKLYSYHEVNRWLREEWAPLGLKSAIKHPGISSCASDPSNTGGGNLQQLVTFPDNLTVKDLYYFLFAPTLCYQMNFPRSSKIRIRFLLRRLLEMIFLIHVFIGLIQQWVLPVTRNSMQPFVEMNLTMMINQLLLIAIPNHFMWLIFFHWFFHSTLNFIAELMRFGDRRFYRDWWNSETLTYFWSNSNIILHKWYMRHIYRPLIEKGYSKWEGQASVFVLSALYHEYLIAAPLRMFRMWLFIEMMLQNIYRVLRGSDCLVSK